MVSKNWLYIAIGALVILGIGGYVASRMMWSANGVNYQQNLNGSQTYSNSEGTVTVGANATMPSTWPQDVPANYAGATIIFSGDSSPKDGKSGAAVSYTVKGVSVQAIAEYYKNSLTKSGWAMEGNATMGLQTIIGAKKDDRTFVVSMVDGQDGTITVTAGLEL